LCINAAFSLPYKYFKIKNKYNNNTKTPIHTFLYIFLIYD
jgi:hypothetical protein